MKGAEDRGLNAMFRKGFKVWRKCSDDKLMIKRVNATFIADRRQIINTINRWENGKNHPNKMAMSVFFDFCKKHGIDTESMVAKGRSL